MIAKHSHEQSQKGEGVEVIENRPHEVKVHIAHLIISIFLISISRIQSMEKDNLLRKESTLDPNCLIGSEKWCPRYFMSQKKPGTTILSQ